MRRAPTLLAAAAIAITITGCAPTADGRQPVPSELETAATEPASEPVVTPEPDPVPAVGSTVTTPEEIATAEAAGLGVFVTTTGAGIVIDPKAPAPQVILDEARASGAGPVALPDTASANAASAILQGVADRSAAAGKKLVFIIQTGTYGDFDDDDLKSTHYGATTYYRELQTGPQGKSATPAEARAKGQERIDAQPDPSIYEIIDLTT